MPAKPTTRGELELRPTMSDAPRSSLIESTQIRARVLDVALLASFLLLVFLLGIFPLNDTDFWWHLRTGDLIGQTGQIPREDPYLFGGPPHKPWVDLHWLFQVLVSMGYACGGVDLLTLAKCAVTTLAVALLVTSKRGEWPLWPMIASWIPAVFLLGGRMYVRPETLTLLYLSIDLAVIFRWKRRPILAWALPVVQLFWVNTQGLFALGPALVGLALVDAAIDPAEARDNARRWWTRVLPACAATGLVCLLNPFGLQGALFPLQLASTMGNPVFDSIGELQPLDQFIARAGWGNVPLLIHLTVMALGVLSFVVPFAWSIAAWARDRAGDAATVKKKPRARAKRISAPLGWRPSFFRVVVFAIFAWLSTTATRNSHQFAAIAGTVTAWNVGEWASAMARRRSKASSPIGSRFVVLLALLLLSASVLSGAYYRFQGEGRTFGLGEQEFWFAHDAVRSASRPGMPEKFVCFHLGQAAVWEYHQGPRRKVYCDARLEVIGPDLYKEYNQLQSAIGRNVGWEEWMAAHGNPGILVDLVQGDPGGLAATLLAHPRWRCVWFDEVAAVFVHDSYPAARNAFDFTAPHDEADFLSETLSVSRRIAHAKALSAVAAQLAAPHVDRERGVTRSERPDLAAPLILHGIRDINRALAGDPSNFDGWKLLGQLELQRVPQSVRRSPGRDPYDPITDLPYFAATEALKEAMRLRPDDFTTLFSLASLYQRRGMLEPALPLLEKIAAARGTNLTRSAVIGETRKLLPTLRARLGPPIDLKWSNRADLEQRIDTLLEHGRTTTAARLMEEAYTPRSRSWEQADRIATLWMHLGEPENAREAWRSVEQPSRPALVDARVAMSELVAGRSASANHLFRAALLREPTLFEALFGQAVLELDGGGSARGLLDRALEAAPGPDAQRAVGRLRSLSGQD